MTTTIGDLSTAEIDRLSVEAIDREVAALADALEHRVSDTEVAVAFERRRQALLSARPLAGVRERARARQQQVEEAQDARDQVARLEADVLPLLRAQAAAIDAWVAAGETLLADYRATCARFNALHGVVRPPRGRELHVSGLLERLALIDPSLETCLAGAHVLRHVGLPAGIRRPVPTIESYVVRQAQCALRAAQEWLPPAPGLDDETDTGI